VLLQHVDQCFPYSVHRSYVLNRYFLYAKRGKKELERRLPCPGTMIGKRHKVCRYELDFRRKGSHLFLRYGKKKKGEENSEKESSGSGKEEGARFCSEKYLKEEEKTLAL